jgi:SAM-dependent methyltransferase
MAREELDPTPILSLGLAFRDAKVVLSAVELGLFGELAGGPLTLDELRARLGLHERAARDFLDALFALELLEREDGRYANTAATATYLDPAKPTYAGGMLEMASARMWRFWASLTDALRTGEPQNEIRAGEDAFTAIYADEERLRSFAHAMTGSALGAARAIAEQFPFDRYETFVDVGCAAGALPVQVALSHPDVTGAGFDLPRLRPVFEEYVAGFGLADRLSFRAGDFWRDELPRADVLALCRILHDWGVDDRLALLRKAHDALPDGGAVIVSDPMIDDERRTHLFALLSSLNMLIETNAGSNYTGAECQEWMRSVGFRDTRVEHLAGPDWMVVGIKG